MTTAKKERASNQEIFAWAMFDFANQGYTLLITTVIFPVLFTTVVVGDHETGYRMGNLLWSAALAIGYALVVITAPIFGAIMDFAAAKKKFLFASYILTIFSTAALYFVEPGFIWLGVILMIVSNFGYATGENFIAAFLTDLGPPEDLGKISGFGWALGYVGGLIAAAFVIGFLGEPSLENFDNIRWVGPFTGVFFLLTAIPTFLWVKERGVGQKLPPGETYVTIGFKRLRATLNDVGRFKDLAILMVSVFFTFAAVYVVITFTFNYGEQVIQWDENTYIIMFIIVQITAALGAGLFGIIQDKIGSKITYIITLALWTVGIILVFATPQITEYFNQTFGFNWEKQHVFLYVGIVTGISLGSSQSASRALVGLFSPETKSAEFFGFWGLSMKLAGVFGLVGLGAIQTVYGLQNAILFCAFLFIMAIIFALFIKEERGRQAVEEYNNLIEPPPQKL